MNIPAPLWGVIGGISSSILTLAGVWLKVRAGKPGARAAEEAARAQRTSAEAAVQEAINSGFGELIAGFKSTVEALRRENGVLRGLMNDFDQHILSLERILRTHNIDIPERLHPHPILGDIVPVGSA